jgi:hypothetical protein
MPTEAERLSDVGDGGSMMTETGYAVDGDSMATAITLPPFRSYRARSALATTQMRIGCESRSLPPFWLRGKVVHVPIKQAANTHLCERVEPRYISTFPTFFEFHMYLYPSRVNQFKRGMYCMREYN